MRAEVLKLWSTSAGRASLGILVLGGTAVLSLAAAVPALIRALIQLQHRYPDLGLTDAADGRFDSVLGVLRIEDRDYQLSLVDLVSTGPFAGSIGLTTTCALLIGVLVSAGDFRHGGIVLAALATPARLRVVAHKVGAVATLLATACLGLGLLSAVVLITGVGLTPGAVFEIDVVNAAGVWIRSTLVLVLLGLLGLGLGLLLRSQTAAVIAVLVASILEPAIVLVTVVATGSASVVVAALPLSASQLAPRGSTVAATMDLGAALDPSWALVVLAAWAALHVGAGAWRTHRTDLA
jgi:hypothetical protein